MVLRFTDIDASVCMADHSRFAVLLSGELRTFYPTLASNFVANVLHPLRPADVFMHVSLRWTVASWSNMSGIPKPPMALPASVLDAVRDLLQPVWLKVADSDDVISAQYVFVRWAGLHAALVAHEQDHGFTFGHILRVRPDLVYHCLLSRQWLRQITLPLLSWDVFASFPRSFADVILTRAADTFECTTRIELCVPGAIVHVANSSYFEVPANYGSYLLATIYRHVDCPNDLEHCLPSTQSRRSRCAARNCNGPEAAADARKAMNGAAASFPSCAGRGLIKGALRAPLGRSAFRKVFKYHVLGNPWCQCRTAVSTAAQAMATVRSTDGAERYYTSPCMSELHPSCCRFSSSTLVCAGSRTGLTAKLMAWRPSVHPPSAKSRIRSPQRSDSRSWRSTHTCRWIHAPHDS